MAEATEEDPASAAAGAGDVRGGDGRRPTTAAAGDGLEASNVRLHTANTTPKDKKERRLKHDDCCRYCERYCDDKITDLKRREIEAWRRDVPETSGPAESPARRSPVRPESRPGFRRIRTPRELRRRAAGMRRRPAGHRRRDAAIADVEPPPSQMMTGLSLGEDGVRGAAWRQGRRTASPAFSRDSLEPSSPSERDGASGRSSPHGNRSSSNELLNVITIDDAIQHHRDRLLKSSEIRVVDAAPRRRGRPAPAAGASAARAIVVAPEITLPPAGRPQRDINVISTPDAFVLHPPSAGASRPTSRLSSVARTKSTAVDVGGPPSTAGSASPTRSGSSGPRTSARPSDGGAERGWRRTVVVEAIDGLLGDRRVHGGDRDALAAKPPSRRFRKMNERLRRKVDEQYVSDSRMAARLRRYELHAGHSGYAPGSETPQLRSSGKQLPTKPSQRVTAENPPSKAGRFLGMLADYEDRDVVVT